MALKYERRDYALYCDGDFMIDISEGRTDALDEMIAAANTAGELREAVGIRAEVDTPDFLEWLADRLVNVYGESPNVDYVISCRARATAIRKALT